MSQLNLDQKAAQHAQEMVGNGVGVKDAKAVEILITKTLGVLQEQGVYAALLFLFSRSGEEPKIAREIRQSLYFLLKELPPYQNDETLTGFDKESNPQEVLPFFSGSVCENLDTLLLVKELYEQTLVYARYGAKAAGE